MKLSILLCLGLIGVGQVLSLNRSGEDSSSQGDDSMSFEDFESKFHELVVSEEEKEKREEALEESEKEVRKGNKRFREGKQSWKEAINELSDVPKDEMKNEEGLIIDEDETSRGLGLSLVPEDQRIDDDETERYMRRIRLSRTTPASYDAVSEGLTTEVRNQRQCGSCAAFSTVAAAETCMLKDGASKTGMDLSEQNLLNCAFNGGSIAGCNGADPIHYGRFFAGDGGGELPHEYKEPYENTRKSCSNTITKFHTGAKVTKSYGTYRCTEEDMKKLVHLHGSVVTALNADLLQNYKGGILDTCRSSSVNHAVVVVGYGRANGMDYWKVKNSWGSGWGEGGYFRIRRGTNECGIGTICVTYDCSSSGTTDPAPTTQAPPTPPQSVWCDLTRSIGAYTTSANSYVNINFPSGTKKAVCKEGTCRKEPLDVTNNGCDYFYG